MTISPLLTHSLFEEESKIWSWLNQNQTLQKENIKLHLNTLSTQFLNGKKKRRKKVWQLLVLSIVKINFCIRSTPLRGNKELTVYALPPSLRNYAYPSAPPTHPTSRPFACRTYSVTNTGLSSYTQAKRGGEGGSAKRYTHTESVISECTKEVRRTPQTINHAVPLNIGYAC